MVIRYNLLSIFRNNFVSNGKQFMLLVLYRTIVKYKTNAVFSHTFFLYIILNIYSQLNHQQSPLHCKKADGYVMFQSHALMLEKNNKTPLKRFCFFKYISHQIIPLICRNVCDVSGEFFLDRQFHKSALWLQKE